MSNIIDLFQTNYWSRLVSLRLSHLRKTGLKEDAVGETTFHEVVNFKICGNFASITGPKIYMMVFILVQMFVLEMFASRFLSSFSCRINKAIKRAPKIPDYVSNM